MAKPGIVNIRGKEYQTVALRVSNFREAHPDFALLTEIVQRDAQCVVMVARILTPDGRCVATGHAEEYRGSSDVNKTSALENAETSAIGRALAAFGLGGTEFASADEVARAVSGQKAAFPKPVESALEGVTVDADKIAGIVTAIEGFAAAEAQGEDRSYQLYELVSQLEPDDKIAVWAQLGSGIRARIKRIVADFKAQETERAA